ncbi:MAG: choice-of-anchor D domain-containing protein [bacterium]
MNYRWHIAVLIFLVSLQADIYAQHWNKIATLIGEPTSGFFWNKHSGIIAVAKNGRLPAVVNPIAVYRIDYDTLSAKYIVKQCDLLGQFNGYNGYITTIHFRDRNVGWLTFFGYGFTQYGVWVTSDGGFNWQPIVDSNQWNSIYETPARRLIVSSGGIAFADSLVGMLSRAVGSSSSVQMPASLTTDGGQTWKTLPNADAKFTESWGIYCQKKTRRFFVCPEGAPGWSAPNPFVFSSSDSGYTWQTAGKVPMKSVVTPVNFSGLYGTGDIEGFADAIYVQSEYNGMFRSTDEGKTWDSVGGPSTDWDIRFNVIPTCKGGTVIAFDREGSIWMTNDGGDGKIQQDPVFSLKPPNSISPIFSCDTGITSFNFIFSGCGYVEYDSAFVENDNTSFSILSPPSYPFIRNEGIRDSIHILFNPHKKSGLFIGKVHLRGKIIGEDIRQNFDTIFVLSAISKALPPALVADEYNAKFDTVSTCSGARDSVFVLRNAGCDTLTITDTSGMKTAEFSLLPPFTLPIRIPPDSSVSVRFRFKPSSANTFILRPRFHAEQQGLSQDLQLYLEGTGKSEGGELSYSPHQFDFGSLSVCDHDSVNGFITNNGCDSLSIDRIVFYDYRDFDISNAVFSAKSIRPGDTIRYTVFVHPVNPGTRTGLLLIAVNGKIDTIRFTETKKSGTRILSSSQHTLDFGRVSVCDTKDSSITLSNSGCEDIVITKYSLSGSGFIVTTPLPDTIKAGTSKDIHIITQLDTVGGKLASSAQITFTSDADSSISPIDLTRTYSQSSRLDAALFLDPTPMMGGDQTLVKYKILEDPNRKFTGSQIKEVRFDLTYNTDLLDFESSNSSANVSKVGNTFTLTDPVAIHSDASGVLATLGFRIYLTKDSATQIAMTKRVDTTQIPCGMMTLSTGGTATFDYHFICGERTISDAMNGITALKIISLRPNPAQDEVIVDVLTQSANWISYDVSNSLGESILSGGEILKIGTGTLRLNTQKLPAGIYYLRLNSGGFPATQSFVKVR